VGDLGYSYSCFFFSAGSKTHSSITGCLLSLALQMAEDNAFIRDLLLEMDDTECSFNPESFQSIWRTLFVGGVFQTKALKPHFWVIDGLDECTDYIELFPLLANIKSTYPLQIFISSRHIPEAQNSFASHGLKAEMYHLNRENTAGDIKRYVENHIDFPSFESNTEKQKMISTIHRKSEGSFMWVRLILRELRGALSEEATKKVLREVPRGMDKVYSRSLEPLAKEASRRPVAKAILMWASTCTRAISTSVLKHALIIHVNETFNRLENHISWLCGYLVTVDAHSHVKMVHETARRFILDPNNGSPVAFSEQEAHESLAVVCLKYLNDKELKAPKGRRSSAAQGTPLTRSPFFPYAALAFHEHIQRSKSTSEEIFRLVCSFLEHTGGNVLTWIEHVASTDKGMATLVRAGTILRAFALRIGKDRMRRTEKLDLVLSWSSDLMRVAAKFGRNLERFPQSIFTIVPQFCPRASPMYRQYGHSNRSMGVYGVQSLLEWDDCIATIAYKQKGQRTMSVGATSNLFAVGMSGPFLRLYHTNTCQEYTMLHHGTAVGVIEFNVNGSLLATAGGLKVCLWDVPSKSLLWIFELSRTCIAITFDSEAEELVLACQDNQLYYVQLDSGNLQDKVPWFLDEEQAQKIVRDPSTAAFSPQHQLLAIVYRGGHIGLWNWETDEFEGHCIKPGAGTQRCPFHASSLVFSPVPNSNSLAASYEQGEIIVFDPFDQSIKASYKANTDNQTLACSPDGRTLLAGDSSGFIRIFDFQSFDAPDGKLRLLHMISGVEEPIRTLAFLDDKRFVDLRGRKIKVWEPTALVRSEASNSDTESIASEETMHPSPASGEGPDMITAMSIHPNGKHIFCATQSGVINIFEASTGKLLQTIFDHSRGDTILWMILGKSGDILATAGISSKVFIHRIAHQREWTLEEKLLEYRMGEPIEQLLFNPGCTKILVVTTTRDMVYCLEEGRQSSAHWETRLPGMWCNNPEDPEQLLLWVNQKLRVFVWNDLMEITAPDGIELDFDLPDKFGIRNVFTGGRGSYVATVYSEVDHSRASIRLLFWDAKAAGQGRGSSTISPMYQVYGSRISDLVSTLGMIIGFSGNRVLFLEQDGWICSMIVDEHEPESYSRHFFLPADWTSTNDALLMAWMPNNNIIFVKGDELAVIKRGLDLSQDIPLSARSRRSSNSA
jgi:WD40 repeat protein